MNSTLEMIAAIVAFIGFGGLATMIAWIWRLSDRLRRIQSQAEIAAKQADDAERLAVEALKDLAAFKLEAARRFVTDETLVKMEERVIGSINRLADRLDRIIEQKPPASRRT